MIKKLDKLILQAFIGPFIATFFITSFVLILQFFWLWIDDFVGKGMDMTTLLQLIGFVWATLIPLALPLAMLLSSIMTFGNLGESFELVAIKSAGIPLLRFMRPLFFAALVITGIAFLFANYIIPRANLKMETLKYDLVVAKPAFDIKEGVFYDKLDGFVIKIGKKEGDGSTIKQVIIYEKGYGLQDNIILADEGKMEVTPDKRYLTFNLKKGWRYQERGLAGSTDTEFIRLGFDTYKKVFDLSSFQLSRTADSTYRDHHKMLSVRQLQRNIDSLSKSDTILAAHFKRDVSPTFYFPRLLDKMMAGKVKITPADTASIVIPDTLKNAIQQQLAGLLSSANSQTDVLVIEADNLARSKRLHEIEWHRKFVLSVSCLVFFLIGAPLGSIIRKGGLGTPLVFAVVFFVLFYLMYSFGEKSVKEGALTPWFGMWLSTLVLVPVGFFLTYKAMHDSQLFNQEFYFRTFRKFRAFFDKKGKA